MCGACLACGAEIVDYMLPAGLRDEAADSYVEQVAAFAASQGDALAPIELSRLVHAVV